MVFSPKEVTIIFAICKNLGELAGLEPAPSRLAVEVTAIYTILRGINDCRNLALYLLSYNSHVLRIREGFEPSTFGLMK